MSRDTIGVPRRVSLDVSEGGKSDPAEATTLEWSSLEDRPLVPFDSSLNSAMLASATALPLPPQLLQYSNRERWLTFSVAEMGKNSLELSHFAHSTSPVSRGSEVTPSVASQVRIVSVALAVGLVYAARSVALELPNHEAVLQHALQLQSLKGRVVNPLVLHVVEQVRTTLFGCASASEKPLLVHPGPAAQAQTATSVALWCRKSELRLAATIGVAPIATSPNGPTSMPPLPLSLPVDALWLHHVLSNHTVPSHRMEEDFSSTLRGGEGSERSTDTRFASTRSNAPHPPPPAVSSQLASRHRALPPPSGAGAPPQPRSDPPIVRSHRDGMRDELRWTLAWVQSVALLTNERVFHRSVFSSTDAAAFLSHLLSLDRWRPAMEAVKSLSDEHQSFLIDAVTSCRDRIVSDARNGRRSDEGHDTECEEGCESTVTQVQRDGVFLTVAELLTVEWLAPLRFVRVSTLPPLPDPNDERFFTAEVRDASLCSQRSPAKGNRIDGVHTIYEGRGSRRRPVGCAEIDNVTSPTGRHVVEYVEILASLCWKTIPCGQILEEERSRRGRLEHAILAEWLRVVHQASLFRQQGHRRLLRNVSGMGRSEREFRQVFQQRWAAIGAQESIQREHVEQSEADEREALLSTFLLLSETPLQSRFRRQLHRLQLAEGDERSRLESSHTREFLPMATEAKRALHFAASWRVPVLLDGINAASRLIVQEFCERIETERSELVELEGICRWADLCPQEVRDIEGAARKRMEGCEMEGRLPLQRQWDASFALRELWRVYLDLGVLRRNPTATS